jgi:ADP-heptose:LPS heptosyltransferase
LGIVETAALIERADVFVGADSGPAHLAAAVGTWSVVLFSGTNYAQQWRPWNARARVVKHDVPCSPCHRRTCSWSDHPCMTRLSADMVMSEIDQVVRAARGEADPIPELIESNAAPLVYPAEWLLATLQSPAKRVAP